MPQRGITRSSAPIDPIGDRSVEAWIKGSLFDRKSPWTTTLQ
jgi:hypothetical protein